MNIVIHVDELVLHGFPPGERYRISEAVRGELARIVAERGLPGTWTGTTEATRLDGGSFNVGAGVPAAAIGASAAEAVYRTVTALPDSQGAPR